MNCILGEIIFIVCGDSNLIGVVGINCKGQVFFVSVDENKIVFYVLESYGIELVFKLVLCVGLFGVDNFYQ